jgi:hypothetical protein
VSFRGSEDPLSTSFGLQASRIEGSTIARRTVDAWIHRVEGMNFSGDFATVPQRGEREEKQPETTNEERNALPRRDAEAPTPAVVVLDPKRPYVGRLTAQWSGTPLAPSARVRASPDPHEPHEADTQHQDSDQNIPAQPDRVDADRPASIHFTAPVADWIEFLAELLAAELLRERAGGGDNP